MPSALYSPSVSPLNIPKNAMAFPHGRQIAKQRMLNAAHVAMDLGLYTSPESANSPDEDGHLLLP
jgi:hypothetical protein